MVVGNIAMGLLLKRGLINSNICPVLKQLFSNLPSFSAVF